MGRTRRLVPSKRLDGSGLVIVWIALLHNWRERFRAVASLEKDRQDSKARELWKCYGHILVA